jgi:hypothetical protein
MEVALGGIILRWVVLQRSPMMSTQALLLSELLD